MIDTSHRSQISGEMWWRKSWHALWESGLAEFVFYGAEKWEIAGGQKVSLGSRRNWLKSCCYLLKIVLYWLELLEVYLGIDQAKAFCLSRFVVSLYPTITSPRYESDKQLHYTTHTYMKPNLPAFCFAKQAGNSLHIRWFMRKHLTPKGL